MRMKALLLGICVRLAVVSVCTAIWYFMYRGYVSLSAPVAFFAAVFVGVAWLRYLGASGLTIFSRRRSMAGKGDVEEGEEKARFLAFLRGNAPTEREEDGEQAPARDIRWTIAANLLTAGILVIVTFVM